MKDAAGAEIQTRLDDGDALRPPPFCQPLDIREAAEQQRARGALKSRLRVKVLRFVMWFSRKSSVLCVEERIEAREILVAAFNGAEGNIARALGSVLEGQPQPDARFIALRFEADHRLEQGG